MKFSRLLTAAAACLMAANLSAAENTGTIKGKITYKGTVPEFAPLVVKGDPTVKDPKVCAAQDVPSEALVVDPATKGIKNVLIYLRQKPAGYKLPEVNKTPMLELDQKGCRFIPHVMVVQTNQSVQVISDDNCAHNFRMTPFGNKPVNLLIAPKDRTGHKIQFAGPEKYVTPIQCDIHTFMKGYWLITDHPFAAVTNDKGEFEIADVPAGSHDFTIWQEKSGYLAKKMTVKVKAGETTELNVEADADEFKD